MADFTPEAAAPAPRPRGGARLRTALLVAVVLGVVAFLVVRANRSGVVYYYTVSELLAPSATARPRGLRVTGKVVPGTVSQQGRTLEFRVSDGHNSLPVRFLGTSPGTFTDSSEVVLEGRIDSVNVFRASTLLTKCPSKYKAQEAAGQKHPGGIPKGDS
jgi:cytochrome c-type biogenesis protein CcmE